jgi:hypothetical protein
VDVTAVYQIPTTNFGRFTVTLGWNHFFTWKAEPAAGLGTHNFLGDYNSGTPRLLLARFLLTRAFFALNGNTNLGPATLILLPKAITSAISRMIPPSFLITRS